MASEFARIEQDLFEAEWAEAKEALGRDPKVGELARTPAQRRADALVEMAVRSKGANATDRRPEPLFSVLVGYEALHGRISRIEGGPIVSPGALLPWLKGADFERIVFSPRARIECSKTARFFTGATRRAIEVRDQCCTHPFCEAPAERCQIDHVIPYAKGGETTQENGRVHCGFHNRLRNQGGDDGGDDECGGDGTGGGGECGGDGTGVGTRGPGVGATKPTTGPTTRVAPKGRECFARYPAPPAASTRTARASTALLAARCSPRPTPNAQLAARLGRGLASARLEVLPQVGIHPRSVRSGRRRQAPPFGNQREGANARLVGMHAGRDHELVR